MLNSLGYFLFCFIFFLIILQKNYWGESETFLYFLHNFFAVNWSPVLLWLCLYLKIWNMQISVCDPQWSQIPGQIILDITAVLHTLRSLWKQLWKLHLGVVVMLDTQILLRCCDFCFGFLKLKHEVSTVDCVVWSTDLSWFSTWWVWTS